MKIASRMFPWQVFNPARRSKTTVHSEAILEALGAQREAQELVAPGCWSVPLKCG